MLSKKSEIKKIQFGFSHEALDAIDSLAISLGAQTKTEVVRTALKVLTWVIEKQEEGFSIVANDKSGASRDVELLDLRFPYHYNVKKQNEVSLDNEDNIEQKNTLAEETML